MFNCDIFSTSAWYNAVHYLLRTYLLITDPIDMPLTNIVSTRREIVRKILRSVDASTEYPRSFISLVIRIP
jgi:hypothetical protein